MVIDEGSMPPPRFGVVLVTVSSSEEGQTIARALVEEQLAACVNCWPIQSTYMWKGEVHQDAEWQLIIKTRLDCLTLIEQRVNELHSYDVPEFIALPIVSGAAPYFNWIADQTRSP
jgi:periplasmic divalent cation tolerance protein